MRSLKVLTAGFVFLLGACGGDTATVDLDDGPASVVLSPDSTELTSIGATAQFRATVRDAARTTLSNVVPTWSSSNPSVATVSDSGIVVAVSAGVATIEAAVGSVRGAAKVAVRQAPTQIVLSLDSVSLTALGATAQLSAIAKDAAGAIVPNAALAWSSANPLVATVSDSGRVVAVGNGVTTIEAAAGAARGVATVTVLQAPAQIVLAPDSVRLTVIGASTQLSATVRDAAGAIVRNVAITWSSSNSAVATVSETGRVVAVSNGMATIEAAAGSARKTATAAVSSSLDTKYIVQFTYVSPSRRSDSTDQAAYVTTIAKLGNDPDFAWIGATDRQNYASEAALYQSGVRTASYHDPQDGSRYPGENPAALAVRAQQVRDLMQRVSDFYTFHTGRGLRVAPLQVVALEQSALYYWTPFIVSTTNVDRNPIVNKINAELQRRGLRAFSQTGDTIHVLVMDGGGGWAGAWQFAGYRGLAAVGDFSNCLDRPETPDLEVASVRARWPGHFQSTWVRCNYNMALGTVIHELGHTFGLPHPSDAQCAGLAASLVMQSHWNTDLLQQGYFRAASGVGSNFGIMKEWDTGLCQPTNPTAWGFAQGIGTTANPSAKYRSELAILLDNPYFRP